jgi:hypothetical protein
MQLNKQRLFSPERLKIDTSTKISPAAVSLVIAAPPVSEAVEAVTVVLE